MSVVHRVNRLVGLAFVTVLTLVSSYVDASDGGLELDLTSPAQIRESGRIGLIMTRRYFALHQTVDGKQECPDGLQNIHTANYKAQFTTEDARKSHQEKYYYYTNRGPNGENVFYNPMVVDDLLPFREISSSTAYGLNLDGKATQEDFLDPEENEGIDNELYRVVGCMGGFRHKGTLSEVSNEMVHISPYTRIMLDISEVDDAWNDDYVVVTTYRGKDPIVFDGSNNPIAWTTNHVDSLMGERFIHRLTGRIVEGKLITNPGEVVLPWGEQPGASNEQWMGMFQMELQLAEGGAVGLFGGFVDVERWWLHFSKTWGAGLVADISGFSAPSTYRALKRYADGYPDSDSGKNMAISSAYQVEFTPVYIVRDSEKPAITMNP